MTQFSGTLSLFLPLQEGPFLDQFPQLNAWREQLKAVVAAKGENVAAYTDDEQKLALKVFRLDTLEAMGNENRLLRLIPLSWSDEWMSPWQLVLSGRTSPQTGKLLEGWQALVNAAQQGDAAQVEAQTQALQLAGDAVAKVSPMKMQLEMWSNQLDLLPKAAALYALLTLAGIAAYVLAKPHWHRIIMWLMLLPLLLHSVVIAQRIMILGRPPVGTLYESVLFVGLMAALWGWWLARRKQLPEAMLCGGALGGLLLAVSGNYAGQGDSMGMLIAVLNTQFWLATHVVCITIGYATALIAGTLGHVVLWKPESKVASVLPAATVIALLFTATGTVLGGIWADQSWGRFWGWDPKENGALLIVLWLVWLLHGRMTAHIGGTGFAALLALTNVVVAISWFGVNLLNVGLHSYGFTNAAATGLYSFCAAEALIIGALYLRARKGVAA
jgi:ABC-type transport system involved in cytochrome c biogenesis permease subunit